MSEPPGSPEELRDLVAECIDRIQAGERDGVETICERHPTFATAIRQRLSELERAGLLDEPARRTSIPKQLGEFVLGPRIGGGGMGVVYRADDTRLGRRVALKVVRPELAILDSAVARFRREVEAVASLQHPGIVPVLSVGEADGLPYFAMELVEGCSLAEVLRELHDRAPATLSGAVLGEVVRQLRGTTSGEHDSSQSFTGTWVQTCLRLVRDVARALNHAHHRKIVHRDIKPSNVMVTEAARVMLVDFGLAQLERDEKLTRTGSMLGSLGYMSPEQVRGEALDERTDVYSLGATLYELLTLREPFAGSSQALIAKRILEEQPLAPRSINPAIPRDAEIVCQKAMEKRLDDRYQSVADFARDLDNVLELRPVEARRPSATVRTARWMQRHRAATVAIALAVVLVVGGPLAVGFYERWSREAIGHQRDRAQANLRRVRGVVKQQLAQIEQIAEVPGVEDVYQSMVSDALAQFEEILAQVVVERESDPVLRQDVAETYSLVADLQRRLGQIRDAIGSATQSIHHWQLVAEAQPDRLEHSIAQAEVLQQRAADRMTIDKLIPAKADTDRAVQLLEEVLARKPDSATRTRATANLAVTLGRRSLDLISAGEGLPEAEAAAGRSLSLWTELADTVTADPQLRLALIELHRGLGKFRYLTSDFAAAERHFKQALEPSREWMEREPGVPSHRVRVAGLLQDLGAVYGSSRRLAKARDAATESSAAYRELADDFPREPRYRNHLATGLRNLVLIAYMTNRVTADTAVLADEAVTLLRDLTAGHPESTLYAIRLSEAHCHAAMVHEQLDAQDREIIALHYARATSVIEDRLEARPDDPELHAQIGAAASNEADWRITIGESDAALVLLEESLPHKLRALELNPKNHDYLRSLRNHYFFLARLWTGKRELPTAMAALHDAAGYAGDDAASYPRFAGVATKLSTLANDPAERNGYAEQAIAWLRIAIDKGWNGAARLPKDPNFAALRGRPAFDELSGK